MDKYALLIRHIDLQGHIGCLNDHRAMRQAMVVPYYLLATYCDKRQEEASNTTTLHITS
jgi:hypothetical protein